MDLKQLVILTLQVSVLCYRLRLRPQDDDPAICRT